MVRLLLGLPFAALVTGVLFVVMYGFVRPGDVSVLPAQTPPKISIFMEPDIRPLHGPMTPIETLDEAPPPPVLTFDGPTENAGDSVARLARPEPYAPTTTDFRSTPVLLPVATLAPQFPGRCQASGTEGYAVVRYDVTANGQVVNAEVVERSHRCFEQAALQAIRGWRYQPAIGQTGYIARGVTRRFSFELNET